MIVIANIFRKLETVKDLIKTLLQKRIFRKSFDSQHVKATLFCSISGIYI